MNEICSIDSKILIKYQIGLILVGYKHYPYGKNLKEANTTKSSDETYQ